MIEKIAQGKNTDKKDAIKNIFEKEYKNIFVLFKDGVLNKKITDENTREFYYLLGFYLESRLPILDSLNLVYEDTGLSCIKSLIQKVANGEMFLDALKEVGLADEFVYSCLQIGENTGNYPNMFRKIIEYLEQKMADRKYMLGILAYPITLFMLVILILGFVIFIVSPQLYKTLSSMSVQIPRTLVIANSIQSFFVQNHRIVLMSIFFVFSVTVFGVSNGKIFTALKIKILSSKTLNKIYSINALRSIFWQLEVLNSSGMNIVEAIGLIAKNTEFSIYKELLTEIKSEILQGKPFFETLEKRNKFFPKAVIAYIKLGETTDTMQENISSIARLLTVKSKDMSENLKKILQPALIVTAGIMIALLLALILPIINSATHFSGRIR